MSCQVPGLSEVKRRVLGAGSFGKLKEKQMVVVSRDCTLSREQTISKRIKSG